MLQPKRTKFRKMMKGRNRGLSHRGSNVDFGEFGLKAISRGRLTARQIESARRAMTRHVKRGGKIWIRVFPDKPITKKPLEVRQGKGKGNVEYWVAQIQPGRIMFEIEGVDVTFLTVDFINDVSAETGDLSAGGTTCGLEMVRATIQQYANILAEGPLTDSDTQKTYVIRTDALGTLLSAGTLQAAIRALNGNGKITATISSATVTGTKLGILTAAAIAL